MNEGISRITSKGKVMMSFLPAPSKKLVRSYTLRYQFSITLRLELPQAFILASPPMNGLDADK